MDVSRIYRYAEEKKIPNNVSKERMIDPILRDGGKVWVVYYNNEVVATCGAHVFLDGYRLGARALVIPHESPLGTNISLRKWATMQTIPMQFMLAKCIEWVGEDVPCYQTGHMETYGKHISMLNVVGHVAERNGIFDYIGPITYRNTQQQLWKFNMPRVRELFMSNKIWACENLNWPIKRIPGEPGIVSE